MTNGVVIYGSYGYTGRLIVEALSKQNIPITLAGRNESRLADQADAHDLSYQVVDVSDAAGLDDLLSGANVVIHCAGPFIHTARAMVEACLRTSTHYIDITGEYQVFEMVQAYDMQAKEKGIMLMPGAGFDVVPSDCLANYLAEKVPDASSLTLAFASEGGRLSHGTAKTMIEGLGEGHHIRENGKLVSIPMGKDTREIDFGKYTRTSLGISWGDISTAYFSTGIPNIRVYMSAHPKQVKMARRMWSLRGLVKLGFVKRWLKSRVDRNPAGPSESQLEEGLTYMYGEIHGKEISKRARITTFNGYKLTYMCVEHICLNTLAGKFTAGYQTPASAYGWKLITDVTGHEITDA